MHLSVYLYIALFNHRPDTQSGLWAIRVSGVRSDVSGIGYQGLA